MSFERKAYYATEIGTDGVEVHNYRTTDWRRLKESVAFRTPHVVNKEEEHNLPLISFKEYATTDLWWVLAHINDIVNPLSQVKAGNTLQVPNLESLQNALIELETEQRRSKTKTDVLLPRHSA